MIVTSTLISIELDEEGFTLIDKQQGGSYLKKGDGQIKHERDYNQMQETRLEKKEH